MRSILLELYKNEDIPLTAKYELQLSDDKSSVDTTEFFEVDDYQGRMSATTQAMKAKYSSIFGISSEEFDAMKEQSVLYSVSEEWLNDPKSYKCSPYLKKGETLEGKANTAKRNAKIAKNAWKKILSQNHPRVLESDRVEGSWFDLTAKEYEWSSNMGKPTNKWSNGWKLKGLKSMTSLSGRIIVDTQEKTIDFGAFSREFKDRRPRAFSGKKGTLTIPSGDAAIRGQQQDMKKIMGFLIKNDPRIDKAYRIIGVREWANLTLNDVMYDKAAGKKGRRPVAQRAVQAIQGMAVGGSYLFHGTSEYRWKEIQRLGFMRGGAPSREGYQYVDLKQGWSEDNVYLTDTIEDAENYASRQFDKDGGKAVVLRVKIPDTSKLVIDEDNQAYLDNKKFANMVRKAHIPFRIEVEDTDLKLTYIPEESDPEFEEYAQYITQRFSKEDYIESAVQRSGALNSSSGKQEEISTSWIQAKVLSELGRNTEEGKILKQKIFGYGKESRRDDWNIDWHNDENPEQIRLLVQAITEEGYGDVVQKAVDAFPKYPPYLQTKDAFIEHITPWAEKWGEIARSIWTDKEAAIKGFKSRGSIAYRGEIPAENVEVVMVYNPKNMKDNPDDAQYNKAMDATEDTVINRFALDQEWEKLKVSDPKAKKTKAMKKWEKDFGYVFDHRYSLKDMLL